MSTIVVFFSLYVTMTDAPNWFGNVAVFETSDMLGTAVKLVVPPGETFGPSTWV